MSILHHYRATRSWRIAAVALGATLSMVATMAPANAATAYSVRFTQGTTTTTLTTDTGVIVSEGGKWVQTSAGRRWVCNYNFAADVGTSGRGNQTVTIKTNIDNQSLTETNKANTDNLSDLDGTPAGLVQLGGAYKYISQTQVTCPSPIANVTKTPLASRQRTVAGKAAGLATSIATFGALATTAAYFSGGSLLGNPSFEAAAGCIAGVTGAMVEDRIITGSIKSWQTYFGRCAISAIFVGSLARYYQYLAANPDSVINALASVARYGLGGIDNARAVLDQYVNPMFTYVYNSTV